MIFLENDNSEKLFFALRILNILQSCNLIISESAEEID